MKAAGHLPFEENTMHAFSTVSLPRRRPQDRCDEKGVTVAEYGLPGCNFPRCCPDCRDWFLRADVRDGLTGKLRRVIYHASAGGLIENSGMKANGSGTVRSINSGPDTEASVSRLQHSIEREFEGGIKRSNR